MTTVRNYPAPPFRVAKDIGAHWIGKPMHFLRLATIFANQKGTTK